MSDEKKYIPYDELPFKNSESFSLNQALETRRTVRKYKSEPVPHETIEEILRLCTHAPSNCNKQGWRFIVIDDPNHLQWLYENGSAAFVNKSPHAILVTYLNFTDNDEWNDNLQSASAAITYFQLIAHTYGIGSCWINHLPPRNQVAKYFSVPKKYEPIALITYGYYTENTNLKVRKLKQNAISYNTWKLQEGDLISDVTFKSMLKKIARKIYYSLPFRKYLRELTHKFEKKFDNDKCDI